MTNPQAVIDLFEVLKHWPGSLENAVIEPLDEGGITVDDFGKDGKVNVALDFEGDGKVIFCILSGSNILAHGTLDVTDKEAIQKFGNWEVTQ